MHRFAIVLLTLSAAVTDQTDQSPKAEALRSNLQNHRLSSNDEAVDIAKLYKIDPNSVTNSHRPQFVADLERVVSPNARNTLETLKVKKFDDVEVDNEEDEEDEYKPNHHLRNKHNQIKTILVKLLERNEQKRKFAEVLPILKVLTPPQKLAMASLISKQLSADAKNPGLNLDQVRSMFGNDPNVTSDLMLPILLDIANMVKEAKDSIRFRTPKAPQAQLLRRSFSLEEEIDPLMSHSLHMSAEMKDLGDSKTRANVYEEPPSVKDIIAEIPEALKNTKDSGNLEEDSDDDEDADDEVDDDEEYEEDEPEDNVAPNSINSTTVEIPTNYTAVPLSNVGSTNSTNFTAEDLPVAEKLRALNRYIDRNGNLVVVNRPIWGTDRPKHVYHPDRKSSGEQKKHALHRHRIPIRKNVHEKQNCEMFSNTMCLNSLDYPADAIMGSIRRNQAAMGALLTDFPGLSADSAIDGLTAKQENKYTPEYYHNRREDGSPPSASGFMCPSTVKYARPQKARATSGQWKYIVNTGEHTQTLRLEKCLKPREPCTYLTENFKSRCIQVYNYHRLLTWDQQNGLHMDIFKVPTCCSCHIEGYSVAFPPHTARPIVAAPEHFPGVDLHQDPELVPFEHVQPSLKYHTRQNLPSPLDSYSLLGDAHPNFIPGSTFNKPGVADESLLLHDLKHPPIPHQFDSITNNFNTDFYQHQATSNSRNVKKPPRIPVNELGLPSYLEPPTKPIGASTLNSFPKNPEFPIKTKTFINNQYKRGTKRPGRRPLRKKTSTEVDDQLTGATDIHENPTIINMETFEDINQSVDDYERSTSRPILVVKNTTPKTEVSSSKITIKNVAPSPTQRPIRYRTRTTTTTTQSSVINKENTQLNRRVNYNYHPIIDFFEETSKKDMAADRVDSDPIYLEEDDWRPMAHPAAFPLKATTSSHPIVKRN